MAGKNIFPVPEVPLKILKLLATKKIPFVIVGGAAIALHGIPRSTIDIDIVVPAETDTVSKLFLTIQKAGILSRDRYIITMIDRPHLLIGQWITLQDRAGMEFIEKEISQGHRSCRYCFNQGKARQEKIKDSG